MRYTVPFLDSIARNRTIKQKINKCVTHILFLLGSNFSVLFVRRNYYTVSWGVICISHLYGHCHSLHKRIDNVVTDLSKGNIYKAIIYNLF